MATCKLCGENETNGTGGTYCHGCSSLYTLSVQPCREINNAAREIRPDRNAQTLRALELWEELSPAARLLVGAKIGLFQQNCHARGMGALSVMELFVRLLEYEYL